ncbi:MAG: hypothetical protein RLY31_2796, partial [Bacteroidota bacterium]
MLLTAASVRAQPFPADQWLVPPVLDDEYDEIFYHPDNEELLVVTRQGLKGVVDRTNRVIVPPAYERILINPRGIISAGRKGLDRDHAYSRSGGQLCDGYETCTFIHTTLYKVSRDGRWGMIDANGKSVLPIRYDAIDKTGPDEWILRVGQDTVPWSSAPFKPLPPAGLIRRNQERERGYIPGFTRIADTRSRRDIKYGFLDAKGDTVVPPRYYFAHYYPQGYLYASLDGKNWGVIDMQDNILVPFTLGKPHWFPEDLRLPVMRGDKGGVLQLPAGTAVVPFEYDQISPLKYHSDRFLVAREGKWGVVDGDNRVVLPLEHVSLGDRKHMTLVYTLEEGGLLGTWSPLTGHRTAPVFRKVAGRQHAVCFVMQDSTYALYDSRTGQRLSSDGYRKISSSGDYFLAESEQDGERLHTLLDKTGRVLAGPAAAGTVRGLSDGYWWQALEQEDIIADSAGDVIYRFGKSKAAVMENRWIVLREEDEKRYCRLGRQEPGQERWFTALEKASEGVRVAGKDGLFGYV